MDVAKSFDTDVAHCTTRGSRTDRTYFPFERVDDEFDFPRHPEGLQLIYHDSLRIVAFTFGDDDAEVICRVP